MTHRADFVTSSKIVKDATKTGKLQQWVEESINKQVKFELLWQGSRDGFTAAKFHANCNNKGPTVTVIKSEHDQIFGGFTSESWGFAPPGPAENKKDPTAFIYSLSKEVKCAHQLNDNSIRDYSGAGPIFGYNGGFCDIFINDNCDKPNYNVCNANMTYQLPAGAGHDYLAGSQWYSVKEIEVYAVKTI